MGRDLHIGANISPERVTRAVDELIGALADAQHRVVDRAQLLELGLTPAMVKHRLATGRLHEVLPGVYVVGGRTLTADGRLMAAALWGGPGAVISHRSAAAAWGMLRARGAIHVTCRSRRNPRAGITVHHRRLPADEVTTHNGIPVATAARTLLDIAATEGRDALIRALRQAEHLRLTDHTPLTALIARYPSARGTAVAARVLAERLPGGHTESELEDRFLEFLDARGIELPETNVWLNVNGSRFRVDCLWPAERVIVELDGRQTHDAEDPFESDRRRDLALSAAGYVVVRVTWRRLHDDPDGLASDLRALRASRVSSRAVPAGR
jgi:predicted transcriptional regulator of viral defense system